MKIKFRCEIWENTVVFQILEMDERFRSAVDGPDNCFIWQLEDCPTVTSLYSPDIAKDKILLRGYGPRDKDYDVCMLVCASKEEAIQYKEKLLYVLKKWASIWPGWKEEDTSIQENENIYEF